MKELDIDLSSNNKAVTRHELSGDVAIIVNIENDAAVQLIARMVVAGVDRKHSLHPHYEVYVRSYGEMEAKKLIEDKVEIEGACDLLQTEINIEGLPGLFGGLSIDGDKFTLYEWMPSEEKQMSVSMTIQEARAIVQGEKIDILFTPAKKLQEL